MANLIAEQHEKSRMINARLDILRQELLAPILSIEGYTELLRDQLEDPNFLEDLGNIEKASVQTRGLVYEMLEAETEERDQSLRDEQRSMFKHDLRNSVGAIAGYSEIMLEDIEDAAEEHADEQIYFNHLIDESNKLLEMLESLFQADDIFGGEADDTLNVDIHSIFDSFDKSDLETRQSITGKILIVDDNESSLNILAHKLKKQGHTISTAGSGREALERIKEEIPDILLLDLFMYDMNGFEVLKEMHKDEVLRSVPVIVITGLKDKNAAVRCIEAGAFDILTKPVNPQLLEARVSACLEKKAWRDKEQAYQQELERNHAFIRKVFGQYMSDEVVREILDTGDGMELGGAKRIITIMMTDIRGFSVISQELDATDCVTVLNNYFGTMTPLIQKYGGVINEFLGDAILAIFGAPVVTQDHAQQALACAIEMQVGMAEVNAKNSALGLPSIEMGIALNTGEVVVGNIGSERRQKYGVVGHHVNLTGRIESFTVGRQVMVSEYTLASIDAEVTVAQTMEVEAKGIKEPVKIFEVTGIGAPYNLSMDFDDEEMLELAQELFVSFNTLSGKAVADEIIEGFITATVGNSATLATPYELDVLTNLRMTVPGFLESENDQVFAKVTHRLESSSTRKYYRINLTSASQAIRQFIQLQAS
ncbi:MAG: adenylate cyclase [Rhodothermales bacterium]|jgi:adenylate cyclase